MNKEQFKGEWNQLKGTLKEKWGKFTDDDIAQVNGQYEQFIGTLQKRYGYAKEKAEEEFKNWQSSQKKFEKTTKR